MRKLGIILFAVVFVAAGANMLGAVEKKGHGASRGVEKQGEHNKANGSGEQEVHWSYEGPGGPGNWGNLKPQFSQCRKGDTQSPINVKGAIRASLEKIKFSYNNSAVVFINNGHTAQLNFEPGSTITVSGNTYNLLQLHFHTSSEHAENGKLFPMEMHLVHMNEAKQLAVVGVLFESGKISPTLQVLWNQFPEKPGVEKHMKRPFNASVLLPKNRSYYHYMGSLTTPPCSEGVNWFVLRNKAVASTAQVEKFHSVFGGNNRSVQPVGQRFVLKAN